MDGPAAGAGLLLKTEHKLLDNYVSRVVRGNGPQRSVPRSTSAADSLTELNCRADSSFIYPLHLSPIDSTPLLCDATLVVV